MNENTTKQTLWEKVPSEIKRRILEKAKMTRLALSKEVKLSK